jgi:hypothetical protein
MTGHSCHISFRYVSRRTKFIITVVHLKSDFFEVFKKTLHGKTKRDNKKRKSSKALLILTGVSSRLIC